MKWKQDVEFRKEGGLFLNRKGRGKQVEEEDLPIAELLLKGVTGDLDLVHAVTEITDRDEIMAELRLAQFVEDYGFYLAEGEKARVIEV